jgi:hypothetical protein
MNDAVAPGDGAFSTCTELPDDTEVVDQPPCLVDA